LAVEKAWHLAALEAASCSTLYPHSASSPSLPARCGTQDCRWETRGGYLPGPTTCTNRPAITPVACPQGGGCCPGYVGRRLRLAPRGRSGLDGSRLGRPCR
jgi:hypothetical protein